jgi:type IV secretory pathway protease TraF
MVVASVPDRYRRFAAVRRYLPMNVPLVKRVAAVEGDEVCAAGKRIYVAGKLVAQRLDHDAVGRTLPTWNGCIVLGHDQLFLLTSNPASFDGRYFGLTSAHDVIGKAKLKWPS